MRIKGAIFDLDGTLLDSMSVWENAGIIYLESIGKTPRPDLRDTILTMSLKQAAEYLQSEYGVKEPIQKIVDGIDSVVEAFYRNEAGPKDGVIEFLNGLKSKGVRMCIATATDRHLVETALKRNDMLDFFGEIVTCTEVGSGKDGPDVFNAALKFLGTNREETYIFEDALYAIKSAKKAGFPVAAVSEESYGSQRGEIARLADIFINSYSALEGFM